MRRRTIMAGLTGLPFIPSVAHAEPAAEPGVVIQTFLKATEGNRADLGRFIILNWLPMDRAGIEAGIFTHAILHETVDDPDCDLVMEVGYVSPNGYTGATVERFTQIREAHRIVLVDGKGLADLGRILGERNYRKIGVA